MIFTVILHNGWDNNIFKLVLNNIFGNINLLKEVGAKVSDKVTKIKCPKITAKKFRIRKFNLKIIKINK